jgi:ArsR family transcriptional regulator
MSMNIKHDTFFKMLADRTRLRALMLMQSEDELCVCELTHALKLSQPKISRHLAQLREAGLVRVRRERLWMYYKINPALPDWALAILKNTLTGTEQDKEFQQDHTRLCDMQGRPDTSCCA